MMHAFTGKFLAISALLAAISLGCYRHSSELSYEDCLFKTCLKKAGLYAASSLFAITSLLSAYLALGVPVSRLHRTTFSVAVHFVIVCYYRVVAWRYWRRLERATTRVRYEQDATLRRLMSRNANTEYGRKMKFTEIKNREQYKSKHPFCTYEPFRPYVERIEQKGESNLTSARKVSQLYVSSGTTGKSKLIPGVFDNEPVGIYIWHHIPLFLPPEPFLAPMKSLALFFTPKWLYSPHGLPVGPASMYPPGKEFYALTTCRSTPIEARVAISEHGQSYLHWLFALLDSELGRIEAVFAGSLIVGFEFLVKNWKQLAADIRSGKLTTKHDDFEIPSDVAAKLAPLLFADPERADEIERQCARGFDGIAERLWRRMKMCYTCVTGVQGIYVDRVRYFLGKSVVLYTTMYVSSESGGAAINLNHPYFTGWTNQMPNVFTMLPNGGNFFEFIPVTGDENDQVHLEQPTNSVFMDELKLNGRYEVVLSSDSCGFYRYRIGDIIKVVDFHNEAPIVEFCARVGSLLDLRGEKTSEDMVFNALKESATKHWSGCSGLLDFTATECMSMRKALGDKLPEADADKLYYVIFVELGGVERPLTEAEVDAFDKELCKVAMLYLEDRESGALALPKLYVMKRGSFDAMKRWTLQRTGAVSNQYKTPRYIKTDEHIRFLLDLAFPINY